jgi:uncharacterized protein (TIGR04255 family)
MVGVGKRILTVHVLAPYPGWEEFRSRAQRAMNAFVAEVGPESIHSLGVRYIDRIGLPAGLNPNVKFSDYFRGMPVKAESMPAVLVGFHLLVHSKDEPDGPTALLKLGSAPPKDGRAVILYDLNLVREFPKGLGVDSWLAEAEVLHTRQRDIFEESITDRTREIFR